MLRKTLGRTATVLRPYGRPLAGLATIGLAIVIVAFAVTMFRGGFADTVRVTVLSPRAGLVMYPDAKVKMRGVTVGKVSSVEERANGTAAIQLAMNVDQLTDIPDNVVVDIASTTVFGAKFIQFLPPAQPSAESLRAGQVFDSQHVTVEINTVFEQLTEVLARIEPEKLNETLGAIAAATSGRGERVGQMLSDLDGFLKKMRPALPALEADMTMAPPVVNSYADNAQNLLDTAGNAGKVSATVVDEQQNLDAMLISLIGLGDTGNQVLGDNHDALASSLRLMVPTTDLTNEYRQALNCSLTGFAYLNSVVPKDIPGVALSASFIFGNPAYTYPKNLPKVAAKGGPQCDAVFPVGFNEHPPLVVADIGVNPGERTNQDLALNTGSLGQALLGPLVGAPMPAPVPAPAAAPPEGPQLQLPGLPGITLPGIPLPEIALPGLGGPR
ncbi:MCE family protein [Nocardia callitridis]|uniref:MCE family protein n=1 Tax=Nocardia callitridis TaxID=648753 RepID=A0ABP9KWJ2_9NOCA